jgi:hypothetical protein
VFSRNRPFLLRLGGLAYWSRTEASDAQFRKQILIQTRIGSPQSLDMKDWTWSCRRFDEDGVR